MKQLFMPVAVRGADQRLLDEKARGAAPSRTLLELVDLCASVCAIFVCVCECSCVDLNTADVVVSIFVLLFTVVFSAYYRCTVGRLVK